MDKTIYVGDWQVQFLSGLITQGNRTERLEPKAMAVLEVLVAARGAAVTRSDIMDAVWPNQEVSDDALTTAISTLRRQLGDDRRNHRYIDTLPKRGYRLVAKIGVEADESIIPQDEVSPAPGSTRISRRTIIILSLVAGALMALVLIALWSWPREVQGPASPTQLNKSIAVLPLDVFSNEPEIDHFASGLEEELIHQLTRDPALRVIARTSSSQFRQKNLSIPEINEILGVSHIIEGSVRDGADGIRITLQLIDTKTDSHLWSHVFDVSADKLISVQEEVGQAVSDLVSGSGDIATNNQKPRHPVPDEAYRLFLLGESHMRVGTAEAYRTAAQYFSDATRISPKYALAFSRLAAAYLLLYQYDNDPLEVAVEQAHKAINSALELDPRQPEALATLGLLYTYEKDFNKAEQYFKQALALQANLRFALHNYGFMLWSQSHFDEALVYLNQAIDLDPLSGVTYFLIGDSLVGTRAIEQAKQTFEKCQALLPQYHACPAGLASVYLLTAELDKAEALFKTAGTLVPANDYWQLLGEAGLATQMGRFEQAGELLTIASMRDPNNYALLRLKLLLALALDKAADFALELQALLITSPGDRDVLLASALTHYFSGNCPAAIELYEQQLGQSQAFLLDAWDMGSGFSHGTSLAYCYQVTGQVDAHDELLETIGEYLADSPYGKFPGETYVASNYLLLTGQIEDAHRQFSKLQQSDWPLIWLSDKEPIRK